VELAEESEVRLEILVLQAQTLEEAQVAMV
jgi:hypothetical protein